MPYNPKYGRAPGPQQGVDGDPRIEGGSRWNPDGYRPHTGNYDGTPPEDRQQPGWGGFQQPAPATPATPSPSHGSQDPNNPSAYWQNYFQAGMATQPQMPGVDTANADQDKAMQQQLMQQLQAQAAGTLNTQAQRELGQGNFEAQGSQYALAAGQRGTGAGAQLAQAQTGAQQIQAGLGGQQQILMRQQQQAAQAQLAQMYAAQQGQDQNQANNMAQAQVRGQAQNDQMNQFYAGQGMQNGLNQYQNQMGYADAKNQFGLDATNLAQQGLQSAAGAAATGIGAINQIDWNTQQQNAQQSNPNEWTPWPYQNP